jgi:hypothetical protein
MPEDSADSGKRLNQPAVCQRFAQAINHQDHPCMRL